MSLTFSLKIKRDKSHCVSLGLCLLQVDANSTLVLHGNHLNNHIHKENIPSVEEELVEWAKRRFGGVTSFTTVRNMKKIKWTGMNGE